MMVQPPQAHSQGNYDSNDDDWYFRFDDDSKKSYKYITSIT